MYRQFSLTAPSRSTLPLILTFALGLSLHSPAQAQNTLSYDEALNEAFKNSPSLQQTEAMKDQAKWRNVQGMSTLLPNLQVTGNHFFDKKYQYLDIAFGAGPVTIPQIFPTSSASLQANWMLFDGLANVNTFRSTQYAREAAEENYSWARFQLEQDVKLAFSKVVAAKKLEDVAQQNLKTLQNHLDQVTAMKAGGISTHYDVLRVESQLSEAQTQLLDAQDATQIAKERLGQALGSATPIDTKDMELEVPSADKVSHLQFDNERTHRLDLQALQHQVHASDLKDSAAGGFWVPKLGLGANYTVYNNRNDSITAYDQYRSAYSFGIFLTWDIFNPNLFAKSKEEKYKAIADQKALQQTQLAAPVDFAFWKKRYVYSASFYQAKKVDLDRAQETVRLAQAGFKAGVRTTTEVLDAELELFRARAGIVNAQMNCTEAKIKLESSVGEKL